MTLDRRGQPNALSLRMRRAHVHIAIVVVLVLMLSPTSHALAQPPEEAVSRALACFADSWNRHDMTSFGQCFSSDADFVNVTAQWWKGRHALQTNHAYLHGTIDVSDTTDVTVPPRSHGIFKTSTLTFTPLPCVWHGLIWRLRGRHGKRPVTRGLRRHARE
jgi:hypothetical protein